MEGSLMYLLITTVLFITNLAMSVKRDAKLTGTDRIVFPDMSRKVQKEAQEIPLGLIRQLNEVSNISEFIEFMEEEPVSLPLTSVSARLGTEGIERSALQSAKMAKCMPELQTVALNIERNTATFYYPSCTRVNRCGGCCSHHLLSCQPTETETLQMSVMVAEYLGGRKLQHRGKKIVEVEQHINCKCDCKIHPEDCTRYQRFSRGNCRCECANSDEEKKCYQAGSKKLWNKDTCQCLCREEQECGTGFYFDPFTCTCLVSREAREIQQSGFAYDLKN